jgi:hypothetical protein
MSTETSELELAVSQSKKALDDHIAEMMEWHFSEKSGCPYWLEKKRGFKFDPVKDVKTFADLQRLFPLFNGKDLKTVPAEMWIPRAFNHVKNHGMFITGGTSGDPSRRWGRISDDPNGSDYARDYHRLSKILSKEGFPEGGICLYIGPQGPRRLKRGVQILAGLRGNLLFEIDMHVGWMKNPNNTAAKPYKEQLVRDSIAAIRRDNPIWIFCTPPLVEAIGEYLDWTQTSVKGMFVGGTEMTPEMVRNIQENLLQNKIDFRPIFGNALLGLAPSRIISTPLNRIEGQRDYSVIYQPFEPHSVVRVTKTGTPSEDANYGERGQAVIYTFSNEFLLPGMLERDEAERTPPSLAYPSDGICEPGPLPGERATTNVGVY